MILGALFDLGLKPEELKQELQKINLPDFEFKVKKMSKKGIEGVFVEVIDPGKESFEMEEIESLIKKSRLDNETKKAAWEIFDRIATIEAKIHRQNKKEVHLHELAQMDTIVDIVGALVGIKKLGIKKVYSSALHLGSGFVRAAHGMLPVPAPATAELLKGVPVYDRDINAELVTPTGAALITFLASNFGEVPLMRINKIGYGAGTRDLSIPNLLRVILGETDKGYEEDIVLLIQTNIDDMNPQIFGHLMKKLFQKGALDVWFTPIQMKKNRPAIMLSVLAEKKDVDSLSEIIFDESTTIGLRIVEMKRKKLIRENKKVKTIYGEVEVKITRGDGVVKNISPGYDDCQRLAEKLNLPFKEIYDEVKRKTS